MQQVQGQGDEQMTKPNYVYVASSWRNDTQPAVIHTLRAAGIECYDFRDEKGFHWTEVLGEGWRDGLSAEAYLQGLEHPRAIEGFERDFEAMKKADCCVLVLPCGRSAHLELGWFTGQDIPTAILLEQGPVTPDLMYKMVDYISPNMLDLLGWLGVED